MLLLGNHERSSFAYFIFVSLLSALICSIKMNRATRVNFHQLIDKMSINFNMTFPLYPDRFLLNFVLFFLSNLLLVFLCFFRRFAWTCAISPLLPLKFELAFAVNVWEQTIHHILFIYGLRVSKRNQREKKYKKMKWAELKKHTFTHWNKK